MSTALLKWLRGDGGDGGDGGGDGEPEHLRAHAFVSEVGAGEIDRVLSTLVLAVPSSASPPPWLLAMGDALYQSRQLAVGAAAGKRTTSAFNVRSPPSVTRIFDQFVRGITHFAHQPHRADQHPVYHRSASCGVRQDRAVDDRAFRANKVRCDPGSLAAAPRRGGPRSASSSSSASSPAKAHRAFTCLLERMLYERILDRLTARGAAPPGPDDNDENDVEDAGQQQDAGSPRRRAAAAPRRLKRGAGPRKGAMAPVVPGPRKGAMAPVVPGHRKGAVDGHKYRLEQTRRDFETCFPGGAVDVEVAFDVGTAWPVELTVTLHEQRSRMPRAAPSQQHVRTPTPTQEGPVIRETVDVYRRTLSCAGHRRYDAIVECWRTVSTIAQLPPSSRRVLSRWYKAQSYDTEASWTRGTTQR
jgi:hypothetical protein